MTGPYPNDRKGVDMALCEIHFKSISIGKQSSMCVILPDGPGPYPVLYLLHGLSDDHTIWHRRTSIERCVEPLPLIVVMPDGDRSFYVNHPGPGGAAYEDHIVKDVVGFVDRTFPTIADRTARAIAGQSMGGYGALMLAMRHPESFCAACSHSGAVGFTHEPLADRPDINALAQALDPAQYDCFELARKIASSPRLPAMRMDCGTDDFLIEPNRAFHAHLDQLGIEHEYAEHPGEHGWAYWDRHVPQTLAFVMRSFPST